MTTGDASTQLKQQAAEQAVKFIESGMILGLGHGSTALLAVRLVGQMLKTGEKQDILAIPCSRITKQESLNLGIPLTSLEDHPIIDLTLDGADEVDPQLDLIKGGGGALLKEKIVAQASRREMIIVDESKCSPVLGTRWPVPVEVVPFGWKTSAAYLESLGAKTTLRKEADGRPYTTDNGNLILDCHFGAITNPKELAARIKEYAGIIEHGLFIGLATDVIIAGEQGVRHLMCAR